MGDVTVKPLVWHKGHGCSATGMGVHYSMAETTPGLFEMTSPFRTAQDLPQAEMQALAQADYERRIRGEIVASPSGFNDGVRAAAAELESNWGHMATPEMRDDILALLRPATNEDAALNAICDQRSGGPTLRVTLSELDE